MGVSRIPSPPPHIVSLHLQELLESRLRVLKKELEDYEVSRSTEEKESKELLVSQAPPGTPWEIIEAYAAPGFSVCGVGVCAMEPQNRFQKNKRVHVT